MNKYQRLLKEIKQTERHLNALRLACDAAAPNTHAKCSHCNKTTPLHKLTYIQTYWYEGAYGWREVEGQFDCPHCKQRNRLYNRPEVSNMKKYFGSIVDKYK